MMKHKQIVALVEGAMMVALAFVLDLIPFPEWPQGGSFTIAMVPIVYYSCRHGIGWGIGAAFVHSAIQMISGWYPPPTPGFLDFFLCVMLDYVLAFTVLGLAGAIAKPFSKGSNILRLVGYGTGAFVVCVLRFVCSFLSGVLIWDSYAPEGTPAWLYSLTYNGGYMIPNAIITAALIVIICISLDPKTLRPMKLKKQAN